MQLFHLTKNEQGFTISELLLTIAIFTLLASFAVVNLIKPQTSAALDASVTKFVADFKSQQLKSMTGSADDGLLETFGVRLQTSRYTLFKGTFNQSDADSFEVQLDTGVTVVAPISQIVFSRVTGEVESYSAADSTLTFTNATTGEIRYVSFNKYGAINIAK
jgi:prepilin-type N-terminal cleavage/methylation domain-containing protein